METKTETKMSFIPSMDAEDLDFEDELDYSDMTSKDGVDDEADKLLSDTDKFLQTLRAGTDAAPAAAQDELTDMLEKAEHLANMMRTFSTGAAAYTEQLGGSTSLEGASGDSGGLEPLPSTSADPPGDIIVTEDYPVYSPLKKEMDIGAPSSVNIRSVQSEISSVGSGGTPVVEKKLLNTTLEAVPSLEVEGVTSLPSEDLEDNGMTPLPQTTHLPKALPSKDLEDNGMTPLPQTTPLPKAKQQTQGEFSLSCTPPPGLIHSPTQKEAEEDSGEEGEEGSDTVPRSPPEVDRKLPKQPSDDTKPQIVEWEKVTSANEGDDDYAPLVDYSIKADKQDMKMASMESSSLSVTKTRAGKNRKSRLALNFFLFLLVILGSTYSFLFLCLMKTAEETAPIDVMDRSVPTMTVMTYDTDSIEGWSTSTGLCFHVDDISTHFDYLMAVTDHHTRLEAEHLGAMEKMEKCKKPFARMRFPWCRKKGAKQKKTST